MQVWVKDGEGLEHRSGVTRSIALEDGRVELEWPSGRVEKLPGRIYKVDRIDEKEMRGEGGA